MEPQNTREKKLGPTKKKIEPTVVQDPRGPRNLAHSVLKQLVKVLAGNSLVGDPLKKTGKLVEFHAGINRKFLSTELKTKNLLYLNAMLSFRYVV